ncbi:hypothetical protein G7A66_01345 [Altererythrobacter sp. SALINAS58]|uniref:hypothetical protein n=1 Tax=Alteripontixanthobacter muriae TaxID=2705546 RepID=UPI001576EEBE|nr:hypothetical protein [Alteripontixanthobacter muriae]NTZ41752.1 hypothetical protein [Alteripontixanthobacter muriae]
MNNRHKFTATRRGAIGAGLCALITVALLSAQSVPADTPLTSSGSGFGIGMVELA